MDTAKNVLIALSLALASGAAAQDQDADVTPQEEQQAQPDGPTTSSSGTNAHTTRLNIENAFRGLDANADRALSRDEAGVSPELTGGFETLDTDRDGNLSDAEFARFETGGTPD